MTNCIRQYLLGTLLIPALATIAAAAPGELPLANARNATCVIVVPEGAMAETADSRRGGFLETIDNIRHQLQRESVEDLALYLGRMIGVGEIEIVEELPADDRRVPIYIGERAESVFGPVGISKADTFGFRVVVDRQDGVGLYGETEHGTSYAIYELLHRLGCRWYMPTELGEVVPDRPDLSVPEMDAKLAPATRHRSMSRVSTDWLRRNRFSRGGGLGRIPGSVNRISYGGDHISVAAGHNMLWRLLPSRLNDRAYHWTDPDVAEAMANTILEHIEAHFEETLAAGFPLHYRLNMPDGQFPTEDPEERKHDPEPRVWEPAAGRWSITDRLILLANRMLEQVTAQHPNVHLELLGYVNHSMPPERYEPHPHISWTIAPIDFNRFHPMTWPDHPNEYWLRDMVEGWGEKDVRLGAYWYGINLAELSAPCPFITKWGTDIRILLENNLADWKPETMNGWDSMMPGYYLAARMTFAADEQPEDILDDLWARFYGPAAEPMASYWTGIDQAYLEAREYAGSPYGYLKIFTPEVMADARAALDAALDAAGNPDGAYSRRVKLIDESFSLFEQYMAMRRDWAEGNLANLDEDYEAWRSGVLDMVDRYNERYGTGDAVQGRHGNPFWSDRFIRSSYDDGARMEREHIRVGEPMLEWKWKHNPGPEEDALPWTAPDYTDGDWPVTHVVRDTWSSIGHHTTMTDEPSGRSGRMAYRNALQLTDLPDGKRVYLWIGMTDGRAKLFVNGLHVPYVVPEETRDHQAGEVLDRFDGYADPARFDITDTVKAGDNQITILTERHHLNELGTGGLMGPVLLYRER